MPSAQVQSQSASRQGSKAQNTLAPLDKTPRFVLLIGYLEGNSFYLKSTFTKFFQEKKKNAGTEEWMEPLYDFTR